MTYIYSTPLLYVYVPRYTSLRPLLFLPGCYRYHLRVYVYQAKTLCAMDKDSFSGKKYRKSLLTLQ